MKRAILLLCSLVLLAGCKDTRTPEQKLTDSYLYCNKSAKYEESNIEKEMRKICTEEYEKALKALRESGYEKP